MGQRIGFCARASDVGILGHINRLIYRLLAILISYKAQDRKFHLCVYPIGMIPKSVIINWT